MPHIVARWTTEAVGWVVVEAVRLRQSRRERQQATIKRTGKTKCYYGARHSTVEWHAVAGGDTCGSSTIHTRRNAQSLIPFHVVISSTSVENFSPLRRPPVPNRTERNRRVGPHCRVWSPKKSNVKGCDCHRRLPSTIQRHSVRPERAVTGSISVMSVCPFHQPVRLIALRERSVEIGSGDHTKHNTKTRRGIEFYQTYQNQAIELGRNAECELSF